MIDMGIEIPPDWPPELEEDVYYQVTVLAFQDVQPGCVGTPWEITCCQLGFWIQLFFSELACQNMWECCDFSGYSAQKLIQVSDQSWLTLAECLASL